MVDLDVTSTCSVMVMKQTPELETASEISITQLSRIAGVSSRTLRHYDSIGLFTPHRVASNGYRFYDHGQLVRLQRILLLRELGLSLESITEILNQQRNERQALSDHVKVLQEQRQRLDRQIATLNKTISSLESGEIMNLETSFNGFNEQFKEEVTQRWGTKAYNDSNHWWRSKNKDEQANFMAQVKELNEAWITAGQEEVEPDDHTAQDLAARHIQWLNSVPGTPLDSADPAHRANYIRTLADMYVADERFAKNYGGYAELVRDALKVSLENGGKI